MNRIKILTLLIVAITLTSCTPYRKSDVLFEYPEYNALYYTKTEIKKYKYSDYIVDDVSNGSYKKSTPNIADYKTGNGALDYDIPAYVTAKMDYSIKVELIKKHEYEVDDICARVHDDYFEQKNSYIYFYDKKEKKSTLLSEKPVTNITYDDEMPTVTFDIDPATISELRKALDDRKIKLSDIIASNTTIDGFMRVFLGTGKLKLKFFLDKNTPIE